MALIGRGAVNKQKAVSWNYIIPEKGQLLEEFLRETIQELAESGASNVTLVQLDEEFGLLFCLPGVRNQLEG